MAEWAAACRGVRGHVQAGGGGQGEADTARQCGGWRRLRVAGHPPAELLGEGGGGGLVKAPQEVRPQLVAPLVEGDGVLRLGGQGRTWTAGTDLGQHIQLRGFREGQKAL